MSLDSLSFAGPARIKVLVVPVRRIKRSRFLGFLERLQQEKVVRLGDVSPDGRPHRSKDHYELLSYWLNKTSGKNR